MNILIVDDEKVIREGVRRTIQSAFADAAVWTAESASEAMDKIGELPFDIVILDIMMPGMSGLELLGQGRTLRSRIKWIVISAHSDFYFAQEALRQGARDYILKPIGKPKLIELIHRLREEIKEEQASYSGQEMLARNLKYLREAVFQRWAAGLDIGRFDLTQLAQEYPAFHVIVVRLDHVPDLALHHFVTDNVLSEMIDQQGKGFVVSLGSDTLVGLFSPLPENGRETFEQTLREVMDRCLQRTYNLQMSALQRHFHTIPEMLKQLQSLELRKVDFDPAYEDPAAPVAGHTARRDGQARLMDVAVQYIQAHFHKNLSLEKVAAAVYLNPVYFSQLFKHEMGFGYKDFVIKLRMEKAKQLLKLPHLKVSDVAEQVGYQDMRHFTQMFRKVFQVTPTEARLALQQQEHGES